MKKVFYHLLAVLVVIITYGVYGSILTGICEAFGWTSKSYAAMITGILFGYSIQWLEEKSKGLEK